MENQERAFKGIWIDAEIWLDKELTPVDKFVFAEIDSLSGEHGCIASNEYLAEFCNCSVAKVKDSIAKLKKRGMIEQVSFDGRKRTLRSLRQPDFGCLRSKFCTPKRKTTSYYRENSLYNARERNNEYSSFNTEEFLQKALKRGNK